MLARPRVGAGNPDPTAEPEVAGVAFFLRNGRVVVMDMAALKAYEGGGEDG